MDPSLERPIDQRYEDSPARASTDSGARSVRRAGPASERLLALQRRAGNEAVVRLVRRMSGPAVVQRAIGDSGLAAVGKGVAKAGQRVARWSVLGAEQREGGWWYQLQPTFGKPVWVKADDAAYDLLDADKQDPDEPKVSAILLTLITPAPPAQDVAGWLRGKRSEAVSFANIGKPPIRTGGGTFVLWSGGASDCIIVLGVGDRCSMMHLDNTCRAGDVKASLSESSQIYLVSEKFSKAPAVAAKDPFVRDLVLGLIGFGLRITAAIGAKQIAVNGKTGAISTQFDPKALRYSVQQEGLDLGEVMLATGKERKEKAALAAREGGEKTSATETSSPQHGALLDPSPSEGASSRGETSGDVIGLNTWQEASFRAFKAGDRIRITQHHPDISDRVFVLIDDYDPSNFEFPDIHDYVKWVH